MCHFLLRRSLLPFVCASTLLAVATAATADDSSISNDWRYAASIYLWGASIKGETATGGEVDVSFDTLISNRDMAFMGAFKARM